MLILSLLPRSSVPGAPCIFFAGKTGVQTFPHWRVFMVCSISCSTIRCMLLMLTYTSIILVTWSSGMQSHDHLHHLSESVSPLYAPILARIRRIYASAAVSSTQGASVSWGPRCQCVWRALVIPLPLVSGMPVSLRNASSPSSQPFNCNIALRGPSTRRCVTSGLYSKKTTAL